MSAVLDLRSAITRNPTIIAPDTTIQTAIAHFQNPHQPYAISQERLKSYRVDFVTRELHDQLRSRYLVVMSYRRILGLLTAPELLAVLAQRDDSAQLEPVDPANLDLAKVNPAKDPVNLTVAQLNLQPVATLAESELTNLHRPLNLLRQHGMRPIVVLDADHQLAGLLTYEEVHAFALARQTQPSSHRPPSPEFTAKAELTSRPTISDSVSLTREQVLNQITAQIHSSLDVQTILETTVNELRTVLGCDRVITYRLRPDLTGKVVAESVDCPSRSVLHSEVRDPCVTPEWLEPYRQGKVRIVDDVYEGELTVCHQEMLVGFGIRSKMMVPIVVEGKIWGLLLTSEQDFPRRWQLREVDLVRQIGVQLAIAIQQAQAHERAQIELTERRKAEEQLQKTLAITSTKTGADFFPTSVKLLAESLGVAHALLTERRGDTLRTLAFVTDDALQPSFDYLITNTPCERVMREGEFYCEHSVQERFPEDADLIELGAESYLGFAMKDAHGEVVGHLCVLDRKPLPYSERMDKLIRSFTARATAELERQKATNALARLNQELEAKVESRTADLQASYKQLKEAQLQLVQSEKMSSLGQLVAGVAHEINNPVSFIYGNLGPCSEYVQDLSHLISLYHKHYPITPSEITDFAESADIQYTLEDFPRLIRSIETGATRIQAIVQSLRTFSHAQQEGYKAIDIHKHLDNTLVILQNRLNGRDGTPAIEVIKNYGDLPLVYCFGGLLNQVLMNLLVNGIDAIEARQKAARSTDYQGCLTIMTQVLSPQKVSLSIRDNGEGISQAIQNKIFNPFFTTKPVGIGTGMGLSISYKIITEDHKGHLYYVSTVGEGTEFTIELPQ